MTNVSDANGTFFKRALNPKLRTGAALASYPLLGQLLAGNGGALGGAGLGLLLAWGAVRYRSRQLTGNSRNEPYIGRIKS